MIKVSGTCAFLDYLIIQASRTSHVRFASLVDAAPSPLENFETGRKLLSRSSSLFQAFTRLCTLNRIINTNMGQIRELFLMIGCFLVVRLNIVVQSKTYECQFVPLLVWKILISCTEHFPVFYDYIHFLNYICSTNLRPRVALGVIVWRRSSRTKLESD